MSSNRHPDQLQALQLAGLYRKMVEMHGAANAHTTINGQSRAVFCSNNYLNIANHPDMIAAIKIGLDQWGFGTGSSRLINGNTSAHEQLQDRLANMLSKEAALIYPTGFMTNYGLLSVLGEKGDLIVVDKLVHASIIDGAQASKATVRTFSHKNYDKLTTLLKTKQYNNAYIVSDSIFSMDGDFADIKQLVTIKKQFDATLIIDEAHAFGALGEKGLGVCELQNVLDDVDIYVATFSKVLGGAGGFIAGTQALCQILVNHSRSFIYTTGLPSINCVAANSALDIIAQEPQRQTQLLDNVTYFKQRCQENNISTAPSDSYIIPIMIGDAQVAVDISKALWMANLMVPAIRPPTVAPGTSRLRVSILAEHTKTELAHLCDTLATLMKKYQIS